MKDASSSRPGWASELHEGELSRKQLWALADSPAGGEAFQEYEAASDPDNVRMEQTQRSRVGQYRRRLRRLSQGARHRD